MSYGTTMPDARPNPVPAWVAPSRDAPAWGAKFIVGWALAALLLGAVLALGGLPVVFALVAVAAAVVFAYVAAKYPVAVLSVSILALGLSPWNFGLLTGVVPKLFGDEALPVLYLAVFPLLYLVTSRLWRGGFGSLYAVLGLFVLTEAAPFFITGKDLIASRNLIETCLLGSLLCVLMLQEMSNVEGEEIVASTIVWVTVIVAALSIAERITQRNPIMEYETDFLYLSPLLARITEGVYRPYATFFHPSEAGTFMALGAPFALRRWLLNKSLLSYLILFVVAAGFAVNATRGVWVGLAIAAIVLVPNAWLVVSAAIPALAVLATIVYAAFKNTPFMQRLTDLNNLLSRFEFWKIAVLAFARNPLTGVGHMQFPKIYLNYVQDLSNSAHFDISTVSVVDNMYLTTLVEHGLLGLSSQIVLLVFMGLLLRRYYRRLTAAALPKQALLVRSCQAALVVYAGIGLFADINQFTKATKYLFILAGLGLGVGARYSTVDPAQPLASGTDTQTETDTLNAGELHHA